MKNCHLQNLVINRSLLKELHTQHLDHFYKQVSAMRLFLTKSEKVILLYSLSKQPLKGFTFITL